MDVLRVSGLALPIVVSAALQTNTGDPGTELTDLIRMILNLGVGGLLAAVFYVMWQRAEERLKQSQERYTRLLERLARVPGDTSDVPDLG